MKAVIASLLEVQRCVGTDGMTPTGHEVEGDFLDAAFAAWASVTQIFRDRSLHSGSTKTTPSIVSLGNVSSLKRVNAWESCMLCSDNIWQLNNDGKNISRKTAWKFPLHPCLGSAPIARNHGDGTFVLFFLTTGVKKVGKQNSRTLGTSPSRIRRLVRRSDS